MTNATQAKSAIVFAGAGDLATRAIADLTHSQHAHAITQNGGITALARRLKTIAGARFLQGNLCDTNTLKAITTLNPSIVVVTLVPNGAGAEGYRQGYVAPLTALLAGLKQAGQKPYIIFASSTGVYHQTDGSWVDEQSPTVPTHFSGQCMLEAEQILAGSGLPYCSVRFGGIYGPGRDFLIKQVQAGQGGGPEFTNRIHQQDAGRVLSFLVQKVLQGNELPKILLACDSAPVSSQTARQFIAQQLGLAGNKLVPSASGRGGNKRCSNKTLLQLGFDFNYPTYKEGYHKRGVPIK